MFRNRKRIKELERRVAKLEKQRTTPALFNVYADEMVPLGQVSTRHFTSLPAAGIVGRVEAAREILDDKRHFTLFLETTEGVFVRIIEKEAKHTFDKSEENFSLALNWEPISVGRDLTILDTAITWGGKVITRVDRLHGAQLQAGDQLKVQYTITA